MQKWQVSDISSMKPLLCPFQNECHPFVQITNVCWLVCYLLKWPFFFSVYFPCYVVISSFTFCLTKMRHILWYFSSQLGYPLFYFVVFCALLLVCLFFLAIALSVDFRFISWNVSLVSFTPLLYHVVSNLMQINASEIIFVIFYSWRHIWFHARI